MRIRFQADNDLNGSIVRATLRREPSIDFQSAQTAQLDGLDDLAVLARAAAEGRILVTHDKRSISRNLTAFLANANRSPGVLVVIPQNAPLRAVVEDLVLIWTDHHPADWANAVTKIPF